MSKTTDRSDAPDFTDLQKQLGQHLRDPSLTPPPSGLEARRLQIYRELLFNNLSGFLSSGFPVLRRFYLDHDWRDLVRSFFRRHQAHTPYFSRIGEEFVSYLTEEHQATKVDPPFCAELAHYEYAETALFTAEDPQLPDNVSTNLDPIACAPYMTPLAWLFSYHWPVHSISATDAPWSQPVQPTHILLYRDRLDRVHFMLLSLAIAQLIALIRAQQDNAVRLSGGALIDQLIKLHPEYAPHRERAVSKIMELRDRGLIAGAWSSEEKA